jgi:hypothetical protein
LSNKAQIPSFFNYFWKVGITELAENFRFFSAHYTLAAVILTIRLMHRLVLNRITKKLKFSKLIKQRHIFLKRLTVKLKTHFFFENFATHRFKKTVSQTINYYPEITKLIDANKSTEQVLFGTILHELKILKKAKTAIYQRNFRAQ